MSATETREGTTTHTGEGVRSGGGKGHLDVLGSKYDLSLLDRQGDLQNVRVGRCLGCCDTVVLEESLDGCDVRRKWRCHVVHLIVCQMLYGRRNGDQQHQAANVKGHFCM